MKYEKYELLMLNLALIALILMLSVILINSISRYQNLKLNTHILEDCQIDVQEYNELNPTNF